MKSPNPTTNYIGKISLLFTFFLLLTSFDLTAQQKAFPTAYGGGAYASGGRGGNVYHVTSLADDGSIGTYRWALSQPRPATIVFDISGVIVLENWLDFNGTDLTIAGQSAPVGGITITETDTYPANMMSNKRHRITGNTDNLIMRYIRVRPVSEAGDDAFETYTNSNITNVIYDHLSVSYGGDEGFSMRVNPGGVINNITFQRSILAENKTGSLFGTSWDDSVGQSTIVSDNMSWLNNVSFNNSHRSPNITTNGRFDWINNIMHNWEDHVGAMYGNIKANLINNYFSLGERGSLIGTGTRKEGWSIDEDFGFTPEVYIAGNIADKSQLTDPNADNWFMVWRWKSPSGPNDYRVDPANLAYQSNTEFSQIGAEMPIQNAVDAFNDVRTNSGANASLNGDGSVTYYTDTQDTEYLNTIASEGSFIHYNQYDQFKPYQYNPTFATFQTQVEALAGNPTALNTRPNDFYLSNPHIPEVWFAANVPSGQDHNDIAPSGYTWLEEYLNGVDTPSIAIGVEGVEVTPSAVDLEILASTVLTATITPDNATNQNGVWSSSDESIATVDANGVVTAVSEGVVTITFTTNDGGYTDTSEITVFPEALLASAGDDQEICEGETASLTASGGTNYVWGNGETTATIEVAPSETTTYTVTVFDDNGQSDEASVIVTVNAIPIADAGEDQIICEGESITLSAIGGTSYLWSTGETTDSIEVNPILETIYSVEVSSNGCSSTDDITVFVNEAPEISITEDLVIVEGESIILTANGGDSYEWSTSEITESITVSPIVTTTYTVSSLGINGCSGYAEVTVTVIPELVANAGNDVTICSGDSVTLSASGGVTYTWNTGDTGASPTFTPTVTTIYTVTVTDNFGTSDSDSVTVIVNELPNVTVSENITIVEGESATLIAYDAETYLWSTGESSSTIVVNPAQTTTYTVTGTTNTCSAQAQVTVTVEALFEASAGADERVCDNDTYEVVLTANQGDSYLWSTGETAQSITVSPFSTTTYTVTITQGEQEDTDDVTVYVDPSPTVVIANGDSVQILNGDFITLSATGANTYEWDNGATQPNIAVSPSTTTSYEVKGYIGDCYDEKQVIVNVLQPVVADAGEDVYICIDEVATLTATGGDDYEWSTGDTTQTIQVSPTETTNYTVTVFNALDFDEASVTVEVDANCEEEPVDPEDDILDFTFNIFPNPAWNVVNVKLSGTSIASDVYIYDITAKLIKHTEISNEGLSPSITTQINIGDLQTGVYFVKLIDQDRDITKKLIVK